MKRVYGKVVAEYMRGFGAWVLFHEDVRKSGLMTYPGSRLKGVLPKSS
jgi:hypothetical protein